MISVIMPAYNEELYIADAINSVLNQSFKDLELIVINDGSTDNTLNILKELELVDKRLKVLNPGKLGKNASINLGISNAKGEWITMIAADDIMEPEILQYWIMEAETHNPKLEKIVFASRIKMFSENKKYNNIEIPKNKDEVCRSGSACMFSIATSSELFPLPVNYPNEDTWAALYFEFMNVKFIPVPKVCINYRIHANNSLNKEAKFDEFNTGFHSRVMVVETFQKKFSKQLTDSENEILICRKNLELARYQGKILRVLLCKSVSLKEKMRALFLCNRYLYYVKLKLNRVFLGN